MYLEGNLGLSKSRLHEWNVLLQQLREALLDVLKCSFFST